MTQRGWLPIAVFALCFWLWTGVYFAGIAAVLYVWRYIKMLDPKGLLAALLFVGGWGLVLAGYALQAAAARGINGPHYAAFARSGRALVITGACVAFAGLGSVVTIALGPP